MRGGLDKVGGSEWMGVALVYIYMIYIYMYTVYIYIYIYVHVCKMALIYGLPISDRNPLNLRYY